MSHSVHFIPSQAVLTAGHLEPLVRALTSAVSSNYGNSRREVIRPIADEIADSGLKPEQMLKEFKALLNEAATRARIPFGSESSAIMERYVTVFIDELYRPNKTNDDDGDCRGKVVERSVSAASTRLPEAS